MSMKQKIYILHGWAYSTEKWKPFLRLLEEAGFEPILLKIPGLTASLDTVWNLDDYVRWLKKELHNEENVILLGHSNGGRISLAFAEKYPEKVKQLFLVDSAGIYHNEFVLRFKRLVFGTAAKIGKKTTNITVLKKLLYKLAREHDYENASPLVKKTMRNLINTDLKPILPHIKTATVIIWGENDKITPLSDAKVMHSLIRNSTLHIIKDARHSPMFTHTREVVTEILSVTNK